MIAPPRRALVLASASPRRAELLRAIGIPFTVRPSDVDETARPGEAPGALADRLARAKAAAISTAPSPSLIIGADTVVILDGQVFGKPADRDDAARMLRRLAGRGHDVITAVALRAVPEETMVVERALSRVTFATMTPDEIEWYVATGEGMDKAGAYALQGKGALFVAAIEGSYTNVIGLPLERLHPHLRRFGFLQE